MKWKNIFDSRIHINWLIRDSGNSGIILKYKDEFNFYQMEFSTSGIRFGIMF